MGQPRFERPTSVYIEARGVMSDGVEAVVRMRFDATPDSTLSLDMETLFNDDDLALRNRGAYLKAPSSHDVRFAMTAARLGDASAEAAPMVLSTLADMLDAAKDGYDEAANLPDWPEDGCSQGCISCFSQWLRLRAKSSATAAQAQ